MPFLVKKRFSVLGVYHPDHSLETGRIRKRNKTKTFYCQHPTDGLGYENMENVFHGPSLTTTLWQTNLALKK